MATSIWGNDDKWEEIQERIDELAGRSDPHVRVGILEAKGGGETDEDSGIAMTDLGRIHEFGDEASGIPERSFIRRTFDERRDELARMQGELTEAVIAGEVSPAKALDLLGGWGAGEVKKRIAQGPHIPPPNAPATIARKGSDRPLVDNGQLVNSINHEVEA
jgi:hypothetical protein